MPPKVLLYYKILAHIVTPNLGSIDFIDFRIFIGAGYIL